MKDDAVPKVCPWCLSADCSTRRADCEELVKGEATDRALLQIMFVTQTPDDEARQLCIHYRHCETTWKSLWSCACDDECPVCGAAIEAMTHHDATESCSSADERVAAPVRLDVVCMWCRSTQCDGVHCQDAPWAMR